MHQQEFSQQLKLSYGEIADLHCAHALVSEDSDSDVGLLDHVAVVGAVSDRERDFVGLSSN